jgi:mannitol/fructose-specific phosphotransferase system IIA component (Ntr-type)
MLKERKGGKMLKDILTIDSIETDVAASSWQEAIEAVGNILVKNGKVEKSFIHSMIGVVEEFGPYMILVPQVAFFHGRPGPEVHEACLSLITLRSPVYFTEFDDQMITCAFGFGAIDSDSHINMLMSVSTLLQDEKFIDLIRNNGSRESILEIIQNY